MSTSQYLNSILGTVQNFFLNLCVFLLLLPDIELPSWKFWSSQRPLSTSLDPGRRLSSFWPSFGRCPAWCYPPICTWVFLVIFWLETILPPPLRILRDLRGPRKRNPVKYVWVSPELHTHIKHELRFLLLPHTSYITHCQSAPLCRDIFCGCCVQ